MFFGLFCVSANRSASGRPIFETAVRAGAVGAIAGSSAALEMLNCSEASLETTYQPGDEIPLTENTTLTALWKNASAQSESQNEPTTAPQDDTNGRVSANLCKWDNIDHGTFFFGRLIAFFPSILYTITHIFKR